MIKKIQINKLLLLAVLLTILGCTKEIPINTEKLKSNTHGLTSFQNVWNVITSDKLDKLPQNKTSFSKLFDSDENIILKDAKRTLNNHADIFEPFDKLAHPNGICFKGIWQIDTQNIYSGYFRNNSKALIIARASTAMSNTARDDKRAFGFAGKIFPTLNKDEVINKHSANFFLIDDLGGTDAKHYTDVELTNEPAVSFTFTILKNLLYAIKVAFAFDDADENSGIRQLYEISQLGEENNNKIITPKWMKIEAQSTNKIDKSDFRDELKIVNDNLIFNISVANKEIDKNKNWNNIGKIILDTSVVSNSCDHRLHFHHPKWKNDLNYGE